jgi:hypothetical protein
MLIENQETVNYNETGGNIQINQPANIFEVSIEVLFSKIWEFHTHPIMNQMAIFIVLNKIPLGVPRSSVSVRFSLDSERSNFHKRASSSTSPAGTIGSA